MKSKADNQPKKDLPDHKIKAFVEASKEYQDISLVYDMVYNFGDFLDFGVSWQHQSHKDFEIEITETEAQIEMLKRFHQFRLAVQKRKIELGNIARNLYPY